MQFANKEQFEQVIKWFALKKWCHLSKETMAEMGVSIVMGLPQKWMVYDGKSHS